MSIPTATQQGLLVLQIRAVIDYAVQIKTTINYLPLAKSIKLFAGGKQLASALGEIMQEDWRAGRPLTCALVVSSTSGMPGDGFFQNAKKLGYQFQDNHVFWKQQLTALGVPVP